MYLTFSSPSSILPPEKGILPNIKVPVVEEFSKIKFQIFNALISTFSCQGIKDDSHKVGGYLVLLGKKSLNGEFLISIL